MLDFAAKTLEQSLLGVDREDLPYIQTYSGKKIYPMWPLPEDICLEDIAHGLSHVCRFSGQIKTFYSVAEHAVRVSYACPQDWAKEGLHHDDSEYVYSDIPRPLKRAPGMEVYRMYEKLLSKAIEQKFNLRPEPQCIKDVDFRLLETEARDLFKEENSWEGKFSTPLKEKIIPWTSEEAERRYLMRHYELFS